MDDWQNGGFGLYVHWPFCQAKCPYCDFNSYVSDHVDHSAWADVLIAELDRHAALLPNRVLNSIFFGGGTPSLMQAQTVTRIIDRAADHWGFANDIEITLEANPTSVEAARFHDYRNAGVNRTSMGLQALNDVDLQRLGRLHTVSESLQALDIAKQCFDRVSFDLIYARQDQTLRDWQAELVTALAFKPDHISLYQLTIEPEAAFGARARAGKLRGLPQEDLAADMFEVTQDLCNAAGLPRYEVSNHAKKGQESRHNLIYWNYGDFVGIGPGAHGRITQNGLRHSTEAIKSPSLWLQAALRGAGTGQTTQILPQEQAHEYVMMGLRTEFGISLHRYMGLTGSPLYVPKVLVENGLLLQNGDILKATGAGILLLNQVVTEILSAQGGS